VPSLQAQNDFTGRILRPLVTVAGTMDGLLPSDHRARAYARRVGAERPVTGSANEFDFGRTTGWRKRNPNFVRQGVGHSGTGHVRVQDRSDTYTGSTSRLPPPGKACRLIARREL